MKRLRRILFNTLTAISLLLAIAMAGLWVRSTFVAEIVRYTVQDQTPGSLTVRTKTWFSFSSAGWVSLSYGEGSHELLVPARVKPFNFEHEVFPHDRDRGLLSRLYTSEGFNFDASNGFEMAFPLWAPLLILAAMPVALIGVRLWKQDRRAGHCPACGYDMRANPAKCSECGHEPTLAGDHRLS